MKVIVGLGNPGKKYEGTRHNIGFEVLAAVARRYGVQRIQNRFKAEIANLQIGEQNVLLVSPLTYMNLSGRSVKGVVDFYKLDLADIMVVCDDLALDLGRLRIRASGSAGGQKGVADIIEKLGSDQFPRMRIGIGRPGGNMAVSSFVLQQFSKGEREEIEVALQRGADALEHWICHGILSAMSKFNSSPNRGENQEKRGSNKEAKVKNSETEPKVINRLETDLFHEDNDVRPKD